MTEKINKIKKAVLSVLVGAAMTANAYAFDRQKAMQILGVTETSDIEIFPVKNDCYYTTRINSINLETIGELYAGIADITSRVNMRGETVIEQRTNPEALDQLGWEKYHKILEKATKKAYYDADKNKDKVITNEEVRGLELEVYKQYTQGEKIK